MSHGAACASAAGTDQVPVSNAVKLIEERDRATSALAAVRAAPIDVARAESPIVQQIARAKAICDAHGARLVVVGLPLDVMVFPSAWAKYGGEAVDLAPAGVLMSDLLEAAEAMGVSAFDATAALREAGEGAFLPREFHLTPTGHKALAGAIAAAVEARPPLPRPRGLPPGRSPFPRLKEWPRGEIAVAGSTARGRGVPGLRQQQQPARLRREAASQAPRRLSAPLVAVLRRPVPARSDAAVARGRSSQAALVAARGLTSSRSAPSSANELAVRANAESSPC
jgi:hypothetical protein